MNKLITSVALVFLMLILSVTTFAQEKKIKSENPVPKISKTYTKESKSKEVELKKAKVKKSEEDVILTNDNNRNLIIRRKKISK